MEVQDAMQTDFNVKLTAQVYILITKVKGDNILLSNWHE